MVAHEGARPSSAIGSRAPGPSTNSATARAQALPRSPRSRVGGGSLSPHELGTAGAALLTKPSKDSYLAMAKARHTTCMYTSYKVLTAQRSESGATRPASSSLLLVTPPRHSSSFHSSSFHSSSSHSSSFHSSSLHSSSFHSSSFHSSGTSSSRRLLARTPPDEQLARSFFGGLPRKTVYPHLHDSPQRRTNRRFGWRVTELPSSLLPSACARLRPFPGNWEGAFFIGHRALLLATD